MKRLLYHRTHERAAALILKKGFKDTVSLISGLKVKGVWLSDVPLDQNEGTKGSVLLDVLVDLPRATLAHFELVEDPDEDGDQKRYREWCIPAKHLQRPRIRRCRT